MRKAYYSQAEFWTSGAPPSVVRLVFKGLVFSAGMSACEAMPYGLTDYKRLDSSLFDLARRAMGTAGRRVRFRSGLQSFLGMAASFFPRPFLPLRVLLG